MLPKVIANGVELPMKDAIVYSAGAKSVMVVVSTEPLDCAAKRLMRGKPGEKRVDFTLGQTFTSGGSGAGPWVTRYMSYGDDGAGHLRLPPSRGASLEVQNATPDGLDATVQLSAEDNGMKQSYAVTGRIVARGCGVVSELRAGTDRPQTKVTATVLGNPVELHAARIEPYNKDRQIVLSTEPMPCEYAPFPTEDVAIRLTLEGDPPRIGAIWLEGDRFTPDAQNLFVVIDDQKVRLGTSKDGVLPIDVDTKTGPVTLKGHIDALDCKK